MSLISKSIPNLINGVSQQPEEVRLPSQAEEQVNFLSSIVSGLSRRQGSQHLARLLSSTAQGAYIHIINRDSFEKYIAVFTSGNVRVFDLQGREKTVKRPKGVKYLQAAAPSESLRVVTVADYSFVLNKERVVRAYDPHAGITFTPVTQKYQVITVALPAKYATSYSFRRYLQGNEGAFVVENDFYPFRELGFTLNGVAYKQTITGNDVATAVSLLAAQLSKNLNRKCSVQGTTIDIPLGATESAFAFKDTSRAARLDTPVSGDNNLYGPGGSWHMLTGAYTSVVFSSSSTDSRITDYISSAGDAIPEAVPTNPDGLIYVRQGDYGTTYRVSIDGVEVAKLVTSTTDREAIGTSAIAEELRKQLVAAKLTNVSIGIKGNIIRVRSTTATGDFSLQCSDSAGNKHILACKGRVQSFADLPAVAFEGFQIKVSGQDGVEADDYYVRYSELSGGEKTTGSWSETVKAGLRTCPAPETMPHRLVSNGDGTFTFEPITWDGRVAGDEETAPEPSFVNKQLSDIFFFKNRLGLLADENVIFSEAGSYYNFYPSTVLQSLDTHPIDVAVTNDRVSVLRHAVPFNETLILFSDQTQFILKSGDRLTKETVNIDVTTRFEASLASKPIGAGKNIFFGVRRGPWASVREYYVDPDTQVNDAADIASHCPEYLSGEITHLAASSNEDMVLATTSTAPSRLYTYKYYWQGNEKVQSSWSHWEMGGRILGMGFIESTVVLLIDRGDGVYLETVDLSDDREEDSKGFKTAIRLDRRAFVPSGSKVPWTSAALVAVDTKGVVYDRDGFYEKWPNGTPDTPVYIGETFTSRYTFSKLVLTDGETRVASLIGRLQLRFMTLNYVDSGFFTVGVQAGTRPATVDSFLGRRIGHHTNRLGAVPISSGRYRFPILGKSDETTIWIESSSHLPCAFLSADWEALYHRHSQRA